MNVTVYDTDSFNLNANIWVYMKDTWQLGKVFILSEEDSSGESSVFGFSSQHR